MSPTPRAWDLEESRPRHIQPHLFTGDAWAELSEQQRDLVRRQRMAVVSALADAHNRRFHSQSHLVALGVALLPGDTPDAPIPNPADPDA